MLFNYQKYKPMITKEHVSVKEDKQDFKPIQGKGLNELIAKSERYESQRINQKEKNEFK